jgi:hypothetical protein
MGLKDGYNCIKPKRWWYKCRFKFEVISEIDDASSIG